MRLSLTSFRGEIPKINKTLLPEGAAQVSRDTDHSSGALEPIRDNQAVHTAGSAVTDFYLHKGTDWLTFSAATDVVPGPVAADRLYISQAGTDPILKIMPAGTEYPLALPAPSAAPVTALETDTGVTDPPGAQEPYDPALTNTEYLQAIYNDVLGHQPDTAGLNFWLGHLDDGNMTRAEVLEEFERVAAQNPPQPPEAEDVSYVYTWVSTFDEETMPSPPSTLLKVPEGSTVRVSFIDQPPSGARINRARIYRTSLSDIGTTEFQFVKEFNTPLSDYIHDVTVDTLQEVLPSVFYDPPVTGLQGFTALQAGMVAGFKGKKLYFCEPYKPHAWPASYELTTDYDIVALVAFGATLAVLTTGTPYLVQGTAPENMNMERIEQKAPCVSADGVVDLGYAAAYPSTDGLVTISQSGTQIATAQLYSKKQWDDLNPDTISAGQLAGKYVFSYEPAGGTGRSTSIIDLTGQEPFIIRSSAQPTHLRSDIYTGRLHYVTGGTTIMDFASLDAGWWSFFWKSAEIILPTLTSFGVILIEGEELSDPSGFSLEIHKDGALHATVQSLNSPTRLPPGLGTNWEFVIQGTARIERVTMAGDVPELWG